MGSRYSTQGCGLAHAASARGERHHGYTSAKDAGFTPSLLAHALDYIDERDRDTFDLDDKAHSELVAFAKAAAHQLQVPERDRGDPGGLSAFQASQ